MISQCFQSEVWDFLFNLHKTETKCHLGCVLILELGVHFQAQAVGRFEFLGVVEGKTKLLENVPHPLTRGILNAMTLLFQSQWMSVSDFQLLTS